MGGGPEESSSIFQKALEGCGRRLLGETPNAAWGMEGTPRFGLGPFPCKMGSMTTFFKS